ncbi:hypothetical protein D6D24_07105 [Aureobasidium pullulans]|uniref:Uncharacterized protein n=1 Tax=Aureobasidium pullulans TaxID=5580 RepID=A0A4S8VIB1_AURPU|nr:hypothetical protein D6D24_07105 [Aureobasidium pullulans]
MISVLHQIKHPSRLLSEPAADSQATISLCKAPKATESTAKDLGDPDESCKPKKAARKSRNKNNDKKSSDDLDGQEKEKSEKRKKKKKKKKPKKKAVRVRATTKMANGALGKSKES